MIVFRMLGQAIVDVARNVKTGGPSFLLLVFVWLIVFTPCVLLDIGLLTAVVWAGSSQNWTAIFVLPFFIIVIISAIASCEVAARFNTIREAKQEATHIQTPPRLRSVRF